MSAARAAGRKRTTHARARAPESPPLASYPPRVRRLIARLRTPEAVQRWLNRTPYNWERRRETLSTLPTVVRRGTAHCLEAALAAAAILEQHGHPPLLLDLASVDGLDHVLLLWKRAGRWGTVARSRDPALHGRKPVFRSLRSLVASYSAPYIDHSGRLMAYGVFDLRTLARVDWRRSPRNVWAVEKALIEFPHRRYRVSDTFHRRWKRRFLDLQAREPGAKPLYFADRETWMWP